MTGTLAFILTLAAGGHGEAPAQTPAFAEPGSVLEPWLENIAVAGMFIVVGCILASLYRILRGPSLADRVLASDAMAMFVVALVLLIDGVVQTSLFLDAALVVAIIGFVSTLAFSQYVYAIQPKPLSSEEGAT